MKHIKLLTVKRTNGTVFFTIINFKTQEVYYLYFQLSLKNPWWLPKYEPNFSSANIPLYGWLFFYFGRVTKGIVCPTDDVDAKIKDKQGNRYHLYTFSDRFVQNEVRSLVKRNASFEINKETSLLTAVEN
jgi:hypothetical protein